LEAARFLDGAVFFCIYLRYSGWSVSMSRLSRTADLLVCIALSALLASAAPTRAQVCVGDCDRDRRVTVDEITVGVTYALGQPPDREYPTFGGFAPYIGVDVADIITAVYHLLEGCDLESFEDLETRRQENLAKWQAAGVDHYEVLYDGLCFCFPQPDGTVLVRDGEILSVRDLRTGEEIDNPLLDRPFGFNSVERVFSIIAGAISYHAVRIDVDYHPELGYPTRVYIDYVYEIADEEVGMRLTDLRPLREK
jgi:hypothetical protein